MSIRTVATKVAHPSLIGFDPHLAVHPALLRGAIPGEERNGYEHDDEVEVAVRARTRSLSAANEALRAEIQQQKQLVQQLRAREAETRRLSLLKSEFLSNLSHEIRTPISAIIGMTDVALRCDELGAEAREHLALARDSGTSLLQMINHILDFSKIEAGRMSVESVAFSLRESVRDWMKPLAFEASRKNLRLVCDIAPNVGDAFLGDPMRLRQVLVNLAGNAIKFTERGMVTVRVECEAVAAKQTVCRFTVSDTGAGIPRNRLKDIFAPFQQASASTSRLHGGSGLGLTISARLVEMMKGRITVESEVGKGSAFSFAIPLAHGQAPSSAAAVSSRSAECELADNALRASVRRSSGLEILLVDDNEINRRVGQAMLQQAGHRVTLAQSGADALDSLRQLRPDAILMDLQMPNMDGMAAAAAIRRAEKKTGHRVPIIALTARAEADDEARCRAAGMDGCMTKPIDPARLLQLLDRIAPESNTSVPDPGEVVLDRDALFARVGGDARLLGEVAEQFQEEQGKLMTAVREAIANRDAGEYRYAMHTLHGMFRTLGGDAAQALTGRLEMLSPAIEPARIKSGYALLEKAVHAFESELTAFAGAALDREEPVSGQVARQYAES